MVRGFDIQYSFNIRQVIFDVQQYYREEEVDKIEVGDTSVIIALKNKIKIFLDLHQPEKQNPYISVYVVDSDNEFEIIPTVNFYQLDTFRTICFIYNRIYSYIKENKNNLEVKDNESIS